MKTVLFNFHDLALLFTFFQCLLFALFLTALKKGKRVSNYLLAGFLLAQAAIPLDNLINFGEAFNAIALDISPNLMYTFGLAFWLEAPLLLLYIRSLIYKDFQLSTSDLVYFLPFLCFFIYFFNGWLLLDHDVKLAAVSGEHFSGTETLDRLIHLSRELFRLALGVFCLFELQKYQSLLKQQVAETESVDLNWLKVLVFGFLILKVSAVMVAAVLIFNYEIGMHFDHELIGLTGNYVGLLVVSGLIFFSAGFSPVFKGLDRDLTQNKDKAKDNVSSEEVETLTRYMTNNKPFLNPLLTLDSLATQLDMPSRGLSNLINRHCEKNFFEFINAYRVKECERLLQSEKHKATTMLDIMDLAGFNSKATFNTLFKKSLGLTPTQFRKQYWQSKATD